jgi:hypothetical protein
MKLNKFYSIDECQDEEVLYQKLDTLVEEGKIEYELQDKWTLKVKDLDLSISEEKSLVDLFDSLDVYVVEGEDDEDMDDDLYFADDDDDDFKPRRGGKSFDDDDFGDY